MVGSGFDGPVKTLGNAYNYWKVLDNGTVDLTRADVMGVTAPRVVPMRGSRPAVLIEPNRTVLCIIDMQNTFLHPALNPSASAGRAAAADPAVDMIRAFRGVGMKVTWVNWGLTRYDLLTMPPAFKAGFTTNKSDLADQSFGSDMDIVPLDAYGNGTQTVDAGPMLMRGAWNARPWGVLGPMMDEGLAAGTDLLFNKNRLSGLWGPQTPFGIWLQENDITTIFFGGVNADQCVWSTLVDAYFKGYDTVYVDDISATISPPYATQMTRYNADGYGFLGNSSDIVAALG
ncbi:isochorismatase hydrolase [Diaporthe sp. PMI_573]|nr:isochorismatase hydrolase [Diaporthaceae sp. PMI_573]